jgi:hypothetical protein
MENQQELTQAQAINVLIQAVRIAQAKGAYTLEDAELVSKAIKIFVPQEQPQESEDPVLNQETDTVEPVIEQN